MNEMPRSSEIERAVLAALMLDPICYECVEGILSDSLFYDPRYSFIYEIILDLYSDNKEVDSLIVKEEIERRGKLDLIGGEATLLAIMDETNSAHHIERHVKILKEKSLLRKELLLCANIPEQITAPQADPYGILDSIEDRVKELREVYTIERKRNLTDEICDWVKVTKGNFVVTDCYKELNIVTTGNKKACLMAMGRMVKEGLIEHYGEKRGSYRLVDKDLEIMDITKGASARLDIKYPFEIEKYIYTNPKSVIIIAGESDSGKTAFLLNLAKMNMETWPNKIHYFNSEMGEGDLTDRIKAFDDIEPKEWKVKFYERSSNFADVICPNDLNIIDFMEIYDNFWEIGGWIRDIWKKLEKGVAVIAIQKDPKSDFARGGNITMEKPRLYLSLKYIKEDRCGEIEIVKGKNARHPDIKPRGLKARYVLYKGAEFKMLDGGWFTDKPPIEKRKK